jgi:hypothetical protein
MIYKKGTIFYHLSPINNIEKLYPSAGERTSSTSLRVIYLTQSKEMLDYFAWTEFSNDSTYIYTCKLTKDSNFFDSTEQQNMEILKNCLLNHQWKTKKNDWKLFLKDLKFDPENTYRAIEVRISRKYSYNCSISYDIHALKYDGYKCLEGGADTFAVFDSETLEIVNIKPYEKKI